MKPLSVEMACLLGTQNKIQAVCTQMTNALSFPPKIPKEKDTCTCHCYNSIYWLPTEAHIDCMMFW